MPSFLVSPAEPALVRAIGTTAAVTEKYGADILWAEPNVGGLVGVQRKEYTDLLSSVEDGRLGREIAQLTSMTKAPFLVVEGKPHWTTDGVLNHKWLNRWTRAQYRSLLRDVQWRGVMVEHTEDIPDTIAYLESLAAWLAKSEHRTLDRRPKQGPDKWGSKSNRSFQLHLLQGIDGLGIKQAESIVDHFGCVPLQWSVTEDELKAVKGLGPKRIAAMLKAIDAKGVDEPALV